MKLSMSKAEVNSLKKAAETCEFLAKYLQDLDAQVASERLVVLSARYPKGLLAGTESEEDAQVVE